MASRSNEPRSKKHKGGDHRRKGKAPASASTPDFDSHRFKSYQHQLRFNNEIACAGNPVRERCLVLEEGEYDEIWDLVSYYKWWDLFTPLERAAESIVKEFYANVDFQKHLEIKDYSSFVRGVQVKFDASTLAKLLKCRTFKECSYQRRYDQAGTKEETIEVICKPGTHLRNLKVRSTDLTRVARSWSQLIHHNIMPRSNVSDLTVDRSQLIVAIMLREPINVGQILADSLLEFAYPNRQFVVKHASLITKLCVAQKVPIPVADRTLTPMNPLNRRAIDILDDEPVVPDDPPVEDEDDTAPLDGSRLDRIEALILQQQERIDQFQHSMQERADQFQHFMQDSWASQRQYYDERFTRIDTHLMQMTQQFYFQPHPTGLEAPSVFPPTGDDVAGGH
ncbi:hypothetical protein E2542_SST01288 [Spatholobus suberectus]|nr:hypothetical protein E2542_SST01288 [Spatholobus suberectus]